MLRSLVCLLFASSAVAAPLTIEYSRQERRTNNAFADSFVFDLYATHIYGDILRGEIETLSIWRTTLAKNAIGQLHTLTAADPEFAGFRIAAPGLKTAPRTHLLLMTTPGGILDFHSHDTWPSPISPSVIPASFALDRVEVQLVEYYTSPIGSLMQWDVRLIGHVPEPAAASLVIVLCVGLLHVRKR